MRETFQLFAWWYAPEDDLGRLVFRTGIRMLHSCWPHPTLMSSLRAAFRFSRPPPQDGVGVFSQGAELEL